jgi:hypothetical protein
MKAKTYKSKNNFKAPQSLSKFGIEVTNGRETKYLGWEEFNFCRIVKKFKFEKKHVAYIPCYSTCIRLFIDKLDLFFYDGNGITVHYATLFDVEQLTTKEIPNLRNLLISSHFPKFVQTNLDFQNNYKNLFQPALKLWMKNFKNNTIISSGHNTRFVFNVKYKSIKFHNPTNLVPWSNLKRARALYP